MPRAWLILLATVAMSVRFWHLHQIAPAPFSDLLLGDAAAYDAWARTIASGDWIGDKVFYQAPLYPYFLAGVYLLLGRSVVIVRGAQAILGVASCLLVADAGRRLFSPRAGLLAGLLLAIYPPAIFLETLVQKSALDEILICFVLWLIARDTGGTRRTTPVYVGFAAAALILNRENAIVLVVPLSLWFASRSTSGARHVAAFAAAIATVLGPVAVRNRVVGGEWAITTTQFGPNFYIGNHRDADGTYKPLIPWRGNATFEQADATTLAEHESGRSLTPGEVSAFYRNRVVAFIREDPIAWLRLLARKAALAFNGIEIPDTEDQYTYAQWSWVLRTAAVWNFASLFALAGVGVWLTRSDWRTSWILVAVVISYAASVVLFYVFARYRFPLVPPMMLLAGAGLSRFPAFVRRGSATEWIACVAAFGLVLVTSSREVVAKEPLEALMRFNTAAGLQANGRIDDAIAEYRAAAALYPALPQVQYNLGLALQTTGHLQDAIGALREAVRWAPNDPRALNNLGVALGQAGQPSEAARCFRRAIDVDPNLAEAHNNLAEWYAAGGSLEEAAVESQRAVAISPSLVSGWKTLSRVRGRQNRVEQALAAAETAARLAPEDPGVLNALGIALAQTGRSQEALVVFRRALERDPENAAIQRNLAQLETASNAGAHQD